MDWETYQEELNEARNMKWIETKLELPPEEEMVLIAIWNNKESVKMYFLDLAVFKNNIWVDPKHYEQFNFKNETITHWMFLPSTPPEIIWKKGWQETCDEIRVDLKKRNLKNHGKK